MTENENNQEVYGFIGYYGLTEWWLATFSKLERQYIQKRYDSSLSIGGLSLTEGEVMRANQNRVSFLIELSRWFGRDADKHLARAILEKADSLIDENTAIRDVHILYSMMLDLAMRDTNPSEEELDRVVRLCENHIFIAPEIAQALAKYGPLPKHQGYLQLAVILEREKKHQETIALCKEALQQGWAGDWGPRIKRCQKRVDDGIIADYGMPPPLQVANA